VKDIIKLRVVLESSFSRIAEDVRLDGFFMKILASLAIRTISSLMVLLARLGLVLNVGQNLSLEFMSTMSKATLVTKLASALQFPVLAHLSLVFSLIVLNEKTSFFRVSEIFTLGLNINLKVSGIIIIDRVDATRGRESLEVKAGVTD